MEPQKSIKALRCFKLFEAGTFSCGVWVKAGSFAARLSKSFQGEKHMKSKLLRESSLYQSFCKKRRIMLWGDYFSSIPMIQLVTKHPAGDSESCEKPC